MTKTKLTTLYIGIVATVLALLSPVKIEAAPRLMLDPDVIKAQKGVSFDVKVQIDAGNENTFGSDATILFPFNDIELVNVNKGDFFRDFQYANNNDGRLELHGYFSSLNETKSGTGTFATLTFKSKPVSGGGALSFICTGSENDTQVINAQGQNILNCSSLNRLDLTYLPQTTGTPTPTPTGIQGTNKDPVCTSLIVNPISSTYLPLNVSLTCTGRDDDGDITSAEFIFGDGQNQLITKNVGSPGSLSTSHTYTKAGSVTATCRLRDNNNKYSAANSSCNKTITLNTTPTPTGKTSTTPTPTTQIVNLQTTPTPTETIYLSPTLSPVPPVQDQNSGNDYSQAWLLLIAVWIIALILAFIYYRKRRRPRGPVLYNKD